MNYYDDLHGQSKEVVMRALLEHKNTLTALLGVSGISSRQVAPEQDQWFIMVSFEIQGVTGIPRAVCSQNSPIPVPAYTEVIGKLETEEELHRQNDEPVTRMIVISPPAIPKRIGLHVTQ